MRRHRVLVVDDEADFVATYERLLGRAGFEVVTATSCAGGLAALAEGFVNLVISDLRLPDGDGLDLVRAARAGGPPIPVIVVSGYPSDEVRRTVLAAGAAKFIAKPFPASVLMAAVQSSLDSPTNGLSP
jgi:DNA-binding response OmpR family regulator